MATKDTVPTLLEVASTIHEMQRTGARSLSESAAKARLNPVVMMSEPFTRLEPEIIHSINQVHLSIYSAMYIQVIQLYDKGGKIRSSGILDATSDAAYSMESRAADRGKTVLSWTTSPWKLLVASSWMFPSRYLWLLVNSSMYLSVVAMVTRKSLRFPWSSTPAF